MATAVYAQNSEWFYATTDVESAQMLKSNFPDGIQILDTSNSVSAVYMSHETAAELRNNGNLHGPGYIFRTDEQSALNSIYTVNESNLDVLDFTIDQDDYVNSLLGQVNEQNIGNTILALENYGTRYHTKSSGVQASHDIKSWWQAMVDDAERSDITVQAFNHSFTDQISVILTIPGSTYPDEYVIIGGHLDSGDYWIQNNAPGADDNASGIATLTETLRILLENDFRPQRTVQFMGYAAEEVGLYGSADIAQFYSGSGIDVKSVVQFDMTNYNGSVFDIAIMTDAAYTSSILNLYLIDLLEHYNSSGEHKINYGFSACGYACSDHASWTDNGYEGSFTFEAAMGEDNPFIHTPNDTYANMGNTAVHAVKFVKLGLEYIVETAKTDMMGVSDIAERNLLIAVNNNQLIYELGTASDSNSLLIYDANGRIIIQKTGLNAKGSIPLHKIGKGYYIALFKDKDNQVYTKKFIVK